MTPKQQIDDLARLEAKLDELARENRSLKTRMDGLGWAMDQLEATFHRHSAFTVVDGAQPRPIVTREDIMERWANELRKILEEMKQ